MNSAAEQVLSAALDLPDVDRLEIVEALIGSLQPSDKPPFDETWREVIQRRSLELTTGAVTSIPWSEVRRHTGEVAGG